ncbi:MFS transporter [Nocardiopsis terrae]|uniref:MFS family permease n=1 Tax=Nocardiopsis terrae TaxID=372655 RepID=A0ABR9HHG2_9ACTN|nr:MFS transporter [Nocardiopsis terrae]MBE1458417.1 MFS family permease [Nocardiopsis terrae]GHC80600.1 MFS transporter [Nocardiopsis terrae]
MAQKTPQPAAERPRRAPLGVEFRKLLGAVGLGNLGDGIAVVALPWYATTLTDDPFLVASVGAATRLPWLFALVAGVVGDRVDRRRLMVAGGGAKALLLVSLTAVVALEAGSIPLLIAVALAVGACEVFFDNTAQSVVPTVVPHSRLERANGYLQAVERVLNKFLGAPLAGALLAASTAWAFGAQAVLVLLAVVCLLSLRGNFHPAPAGGPRPSVRSMLREGMVWLWRHPVLRPLALVTGASNLASALMGSVLVLFAQDVLDVGPQGYGLLMTVTAAGAVLGALVVPSFSARIHPSTALTVILAVLGASALTVGLLHDVAVFAVCYLLTGFASTWWNITVLSLFQRLTPDRLRSRAFSAHRTLSWGMLSVGLALGGALAAALEGPLGREWALSAPFVGAGLIGLALAWAPALVLTAGAIDRALAEAPDPA